MQHFLFSSCKRHKFLSIAGLAVSLSLSSLGGAVYAQDKTPSENAKPVEQSKELEAMKERLRQLEERFINMQSRLGTIESMAGQVRSSSQAQSSASSPSAQSGYGGQVRGGQRGFSTDESQGQGITQSDSDAQTGRGVMGSGQVDDSQIPAPIPTRKRRRIDDSGAFKPFGDQSALQPKGSIEEGQAKAKVASRAPRVNDNTGRLDVRQKTKVLHAPQGLDSSSPQSLYQASYKMLLKPNYQVAEKGFSYFLQRFPRDKRASNAQYWLGEVYFVQKKYKNAATAYLRGYKKFPNSNKAPDSFLKLAVSLKKLGQKKAACATFKAFPSKYPNATSYVNRRYKIMVAQAGC